MCSDSGWSPHPSPQASQGLPCALPPRTRRWHYHRRSMALTKTVPGSCQRAGRWGSRQAAEGDLGVTKQPDSVTSGLCYSHNEQTYMRLYRNDFLVALALSSLKAFWNNHFFTVVVGKMHGSFGCVFFPPISSGEILNCCSCSGKLADDAAGNLPSAQFCGSFHCFMTSSWGCGSAPGLYRPPWISFKGRGKIY